MTIFPNDNIMKRRIFVKNMAYAGIGIGAVSVNACSPSSSKSDNEAKNIIEESTEPFFKLSLAQWSIHRMIQDDGLDPYQFASLAKKWGFEGLEYVSQLYMTKKESMGGEGFTNRMDSLVKRLKEEAASNGMKSLIMMMDLEDDVGDLAWSDESKRTRAIEAHYPWINASKEIGCHSVRINLFGEKDRAAWKAASIETLNALGEYAKGSNINIIVENHGWLSSDSALLMEVINEVGRDNVGTLPDFGNFCVKRPDNSRWGGCLEEYDRYKGVKEMMPKAKAVSAKSGNFDGNGNEINTDYRKMLQIVKDAEYTGYIGVEYEGNDLSEEEGILATKELLIKSAKAISK